MILPQSFYNQPALKVAQNLLGCFLVRKLPSVAKGVQHSSLFRRSSCGGRVECRTPYWRFKIVETEAYNGPNDLASHACRGQTPRNKVMFGPPGIIYVYLTYGMHYMLNIVTGRIDYPAAILIRAVEPLPPPNLPLNKGEEVITSGPAKLTRALGVDKNFNGRPIYKKKYGLWIEDRKEAIKQRQVIKTTRIGIDYAGKYKDKLWRFYIKDSKFISKK